MKETDMLLSKEPHTYDFQDILIQPAVSSNIDSRKDINLVDSSINGVPIMAANMINIGNFQMAQALQKHQMFTAVQKHFAASDWKHNVNNPYLVPTIGADTESINRFKAIADNLNELTSFVCFDVANGHTVKNMSTAMELMKWIKSEIPSVKFIYGNIANPETVRYMHQTLGFYPDYIKIGIGSGSVCTTRIKTGIGIPQASLLDEFNGFALHYDDNMPKIVSDGGCRTPGDVVKAFVLGADIVMLGGMLAFHEEGREPGLGRTGDAMSLYGNSSEKANGYNPELTYRTVEGINVTQRSRGSVHITVQDILGGIRSACTMLGCENITELKNCRGNIRVARRQTDNYV